jgi:hypothetical protein
LGTLLVLPLPLAFVGGFILGLLLGAEAQAYTLLLEMAIIVVSLIAVLVLGRRVRQPAVVATASGGGLVTAGLKPEMVVAKKSQGALTYALLGLAGFSAIVTCPLAFARAGQALHLIDEHGVGEQHRNTARLARVLAVAILLFYVVAALGILGLYWLI